MDRRGRPRVQTLFDDPSLTVQSDAERASIKHILGKYREMGVVAGMQQAGEFVDLSELTDYASAMRVVKASEHAFMQLPASARKAFKNDPAEWLDAVQGADSDPEKKNALVEAGLIPPDPVAPGGAVEGGGEAPPVA